MTTFERLLSELGEALGIDISPGSDGIAEVSADGRIVLLRTDETGEREALVFSIVATAPEGGSFSAATLSTALEMDLFGRDVAGHHLGLFAGSLLLSASLPLEGLDAETLAERILAVSRLARELSGRLTAAEAVAALDEPGEPGVSAGSADGFLAV